MERKYRIAKIEKSKKFSQKEVAELSGFTRRQLGSLEDTGIIKPQRSPAILYTWKQLIFLKILCWLRQCWSLQQIEKALKDPNKNIDIDAIVETINFVDTVYFGEAGTIGNLTIYIQFNKCTNISEIERKSLHRMMEEMPEILIDDGLEVGQGKFTVVVVPKLIAELKELAKNINIQDFEQKVS
jgi:DNA-binding transcriptional MerR regulator